MMSWSVYLIPIHRNQIALHRQVDELEVAPLLIQIHYRYHCLEYFLLPKICSFLPELICEKIGGSRPKEKRMVDASCYIFWGGKKSCRAMSSGTDDT